MTTLGIHRQAFDPQFAGTYLLLQSYDLRPHTTHHNHITPFMSSFTKYRIMAIDVTRLVSMMDPN